MNIDEQRAKRIINIIAGTQAGEEIEEMLDEPAQFLVVEYGADCALFAMAALTLDEAAVYINDSETQRDSVKVYDLDTQEIWHPQFEVTRFFEPYGKTPQVHNVHPQR